MANPTGFLNPLTQGMYGGPNPNGAAPQANLTGVQDWQGGPAGALPGQDIQSQQEAIKLANQTALGNGPSAAEDMLKAQNARTLANTNAMASSAPGRSGAEARRTAMLAGSAATQNLGADAAAARSAEQLKGEGLMGELSSGARGQDIENAKLAESGAMGNANLALGQNELNLKASEFSAQQNQEQMKQMLGLVEAGGMIATGADAPMANGIELVEPGKGGQGARWAIREMPDFLMAIDRKNNRLMKFAMQPLSPEEEHMARNGQHGAGPLPVNGQPVNTGPGKFDPMGGQAYPDNNQPRTQRVAVAAGDSAGRTLRDMPAAREAHAGLYVAHDLDPSMSGAGSAGGQAANAMNDQRAPSYNTVDGPQDSALSDEDFGRMLAQSTYGGPEASGNQYAVPGFQSQKPFYRGPDPEDQPGSEDDWKAADQTIQTSHSNNNGWKPEMAGKGLSDSPSSPSAAKAPDQKSGGSKLGKILVGALGGYANPEATQQAISNRLMGVQGGGGAAAGQKPQASGDDNGVVKSILSEQFKQPRQYADMTVGETTETPNDAPEEDALPKSRTQQYEVRSGAYKPNVFDRYPQPGPTTDQGTSDTYFNSPNQAHAAIQTDQEGLDKDVYSSLPQGLETTGSYANQLALKNESKDAMKGRFSGMKMPTALPKGAVPVTNKSAPLVQMESQYHPNGTPQFTLPTDKSDNPDVLYGPDQKRWTKSGEDSYTPAGPAPREPTSVTRTYMDRPRSQGGVPASEDVTKSASGLRDALGSVRVRPGNPPSSEPITKEDLYQLHKAEVDKWRQQGVEEVDKPSKPAVAKEKPKSPLQKRFSTPVRRARASKPQPRQ